MIHFELVTPERLVFSTDVEQLTLPTKDGEITVLKNHLPLVAVLVPGIARLVTKEGIEEVAVSGGFIEVLADNRVRVLADTAERGTELDLGAIEEAKKRAEELMKTAATKDDASYAAAYALLERETARERVARRSRGSRRGISMDGNDVPGINETV